LTTDVAKEKDETQMANQATGANLDRKVRKEYAEVQHGGLMFRVTSAIEKWLIHQQFD
jgi:hypothetical protein